MFDEREKKQKETPKLYPYNRREDVLCGKNKQTNKREKKTSLKFSTLRKRNKHTLDTVSVYLPNDEQGFGEKWAPLGRISWDDNTQHQLQRRTKKNTHKNQTNKRKIYITKCSGTCPHVGTA